MSKKLIFKKKRFRFAGDLTRFQSQDITHSLQIREKLYNKMSLKKRNMKPNINLFPQNYLKKSLFIIYNN